MTVLRLTKPDGTPTLTRKEQKLLAEARRLAKHAQLAADFVAMGVEDGNPGMVAAGGRALLSIGVLLRDLAVEAEC